MPALPHPIQRILDFYTDSGYFDNLRRIALPIIAQQFILSALNMVGVVLIGQKGEMAVAAVGIANQVFFLLNLVHFGIISGAAMFTAQFWGKGDLPNLHRTLGLCLTLAVSASLVFLALAEFFPREILEIYSRDPAVIGLGAGYLQIFAWTFVFFAVTFSFALVLRSTGDVTTPTAVSVSALGFSTLLSYGLIFGKFGLPELGVRGAAVSVLIARALECFALLSIIYIKKSPIAAGLRELFQVDIGFLRRILGPVVPVMLNELFWALGITAYNVIYGHMGTDSLAAMNMVAPIDQLALVLFQGVSSATSVLVGNRIGAGHTDEAFRYAGRSLGLGVVSGLIIGFILNLTKSHILALYNVSPEVIEDASRVLTIVSIFLWLRFNNMTIVVGILRAGGDTRFSLVLDGLIIWIVGVPLAFAAAFIFHLPIYFVYLCAMGEEMTKWALGMRRFSSRRWIHDLAQGG
jgi:putative MATE family efflux protein